MIVLTMADQTPRFKLFLYITCVAVAGFLFNYELINQTRGSKTYADRQSPSSLFSWLRSNNIVVNVSTKLTGIVKSVYRKTVVEKQLRVNSDESVTFSSEKYIVKLEECPKQPGGLLGTIKPNTNNTELFEIEAKYPEVMKGGNFHPKDCQPQQKLAILIPFRNREAHLHILLNNLLAILIRQKLDFTIFVVEQEPPTTFNRGMLFNIGYLEAVKRGNYSCFILHDVDLIPITDRCIYRCTHNPRHFLTGVSKWKYRLAYKKLFGGVTGFTATQFKTINGESNLYFGWGGEDDDIRIRTINKGYSILRYPYEMGLFDMISHKRDTTNQPNPARFKLLATAKSRQDVEGLNSAKYKVVDIVEESLFTRIRVFINMTKMLMTAPESLRNTKEMQQVIKQAKQFD